MRSVRHALVELRCLLVFFALTVAPAEADVSPVVHAEDAPLSPSELHECDVVQPIEDLSGPELVAEHRSEFGTSSIWRTAGHLQLVINDVLMSDTRDEHIYHEMLVLPAMLAAERPPSQVLVIGGGEGATLREVLRHPRVEDVMMVDIDEGTVNICREHLAKMHQGSFEDPRAHVIFGDGRAFARDAPAGRYDIVVVDGVDFESCGEHALHGNGLYSSEFYQDLYNLLKPGGVLTQYMSEMSRVDEMLDAGFAEVLHLNVEVPSFAGGGARIALAAKAIDIPGASLPLERRLQSGVEIGSPSAGWSYLAPETLSAGLDRAQGIDEIILQKGSRRRTYHSTRRRRTESGRRRINYGENGGRRRTHYGGTLYYNGHVIVHRRNDRCFDANYTEVLCPPRSSSSWWGSFFAILVVILLFGIAIRCIVQNCCDMLSRSTDVGGTQRDAQEAFFPKAHGDRWQQSSFNPRAQQIVEMAEMEGQMPRPGIAGYIAALRDEYVFNQSGAVGLFWDTQSGTLPPNFNAPYLQSLEDQVRDAPNKSLAIELVEACLMPGGGGGGFEPGANYEVI